MSPSATIRDPFSPSVLLIRLDAIGDALALTPLLAALGESGIAVDLVLRNANRDVFARRAYRNRYIAPFSLRSETSANHKAIDSFGRALARNGYTHALVATEDPSGYRLAQAVNAPARIGFNNGWGKPLKTVWTRTILTESHYRSAGLDPRAPHECAVLFELGRSMLGDAVPSRDPAVLRPLVLEHEAPRGDRVVVQITDKWERLGIAFDDVTRMLALLTERYPSLTTISARAETDYARRIALATGHTPESFADLDGWKGAIAGARALVGPDSGAIHVAGMTGTPTVAVFPPIKDFIMQTARWTPWAAPFRAVRGDTGWPARAVEGLDQLLEGKQTAR